MKAQHTQAVMSALPPEKKSAKVRNTFLGVLLVVFGILLSVGTFAIVLTLRLFDKWMLVPLVLGVFMAITGAHVWSGELVSASVRDVTTLVRFWKKNGKE